LHKDGSTERDNLKAAAEQGNKEAAAALKNAPRLPAKARYLWEYFKQLHGTRANYGWGPVALSYVEIEAWSRLHHVKLDPWELDAILRLDSLFLASCAKVAKEQEG